MNTTAFSTETNTYRELWFRSLSRTALLTGTLQLAALAAQYYVQAKTPPLLLVKYFALPVFGRSAIEGGLLVFTWGLVIHFAILFLISSLLFLLYPLMAAYIRHWPVIGTLLGLATGITWQFVLAPLFHWPPAAQGPEGYLLACGLPVLTIGWPLSFNAQRFHKKQKSASPLG